MKQGFPGHHKLSLSVSNRKWGFKGAQADAALVAILARRLRACLGAGLRQGSLRARELQHHAAALARFYLW